MTAITQPMFAARLRNPSDLRLPCWGTPKLDGIRCLVFSGVPYTRSFKPLRNSHVRDRLAELPPGMFDGELVAPGGFQASQSAFMSYDGSPDFEYWVFDYIYDNPDLPYADRRKLLEGHSLPPWCRTVGFAPLSTLDEFLGFHADCIAVGYEGVVTRDPAAPYICGRWTLQKQGMVKYKEYCTSEAVVLGFEEARRNDNPITYNAIGRAKRLGGQELKVPKGTLGSFQVRDLRSGVLFDVGTGLGLTAELRQHIWDNRPLYIGKVLTYSFQGSGVKDRPRFPSFLGFREDL